VTSAPDASSGAIYVMPDNAIFEITGVLQVIPAWVAAAALARRLLDLRR
jgi:hypothetical protein